jgi:hypothetical protein
MAPSVELAFSPTVQQSLVVGHDTPESTAGPLDSTGVAHIAPASLVSISTPAPLSVSPTAAQIAAVGHDTPLSWYTEDGAGSEVQVLPPSVVARIKPPI